MIKYEADCSPECSGKGTDEASGKVKSLTYQRSEMTEEEEAENMEDETDAGCPCELSVYLKEGEAGGAAANPPCAADCAEACGASQEDDRTMEGKNKMAARSAFMDPEEESNAFE